MPTLILQIAALMLLAGLIGAALGCLTRRFLSGRVEESISTRLKPAVAAAAPAAAAAAATSTPANVRITPAAPRTAAEGPKIGASASPAPTPARTAAPSPAASAAKPADYDYPITTVGIPRGMPERVQPKIQTVELAAQPPAATAPATAAAKAPAAAPAAPATVTIKTPAKDTDYPVTTVGLPGGHPAGPEAASTAAPQPSAAKPEPSRFDRALAGEPQPRPEPLRPELSRPSSAQPAKTEGEPYTPVAASSAAMSALAARAAAAAQAPAATLVPATAAAPPVAAAPAASRDDLQRIRAIDGALMGRLHGAGVNRFADIAGWTKDDVTRLSQSLGLGSRITHENWIEQAQILAGGGETDYSRRRARGEIAAAPVQANPAPAQAPAAAATPVTAAVAAAAATAAASAAARNAGAQEAAPVKITDAIRENVERLPSRNDMTALRSVRSEALTEGPRSGGSRPVGPAEDLKRIRGIGVLIEKKLNSLGVTTYEQVANWTKPDIDRISQILDFKGRIERENWVEQARILASGGQTEFSRRVDRGEA